MNASRKTQLNSEDRPLHHDDASFPELLRRLGHDSAELVRQELQLAKLEVKETAQGVARDALTLGSGLGLLAAGGLAATAGLILLLARLLGDSYWLAAAIIGAVYILTGSLVVRHALNRLKARDLKPTQTVATLDEDRRWLKQEFHDLRKDG